MRKPQVESKSAAYKQKSRDFLNMESNFIVAELFGVFGQRSDLRWNVIVLYCIDDAGIYLLRV